MSRKLKVPTATTLVLDALVRADDFLTAKQLQAVTRLDVCHVSAALHHLRKYRAAACIEQPDALWWFATCEDDLRTRTVEERVPESRRRNRRRKMTA